VSPAAGKSPAPEGRYAFKKNERLRRRSEFSALFQSGKRIHSEYLTVILSTNTSDVRRLGLVVEQAQAFGLAGYPDCRQERLLVHEIPGPLQ
jgi:hypothetical protein